MVYECQDIASVAIRTRTGLRSRQPLKTIPANMQGKEETNDDDQKDLKKVVASSQRRMNLNRLRQLPNHDHKPTDKVLTFLQQAKKENMPVRSGKWNEQEEKYLRMLVQLFISGIINDLNPKTSMRSWLANMLHCCPMRISKKQMHGEKFKGKIKYRRSTERIEKLTQSEYDQLSNDIHLLRSNFLKHWAKEEYTRQKEPGFDAWYAKVLKAVPTPTIAYNERLVPSRIRFQSESIAKFKKQLDLIRQREQGYFNTSDAKRTSLKRSRFSEHIPAQCKSPRSATSTSISSLWCAPGITFNEIFGPLFQFDEEMEEENIWGDELIFPSLNDSRDVIKNPFIVDFGPPSMWYLDRNNTKKDAIVIEVPEFENNSFLDSTFPLVDPELLVPYDLPVDSWFNNVQSSCFPTLQL